MKLPFAEAERKQIAGRLQSEFPVQYEVREIT